jgi:hypothetical protein
MEGDSVMRRHYIIGMFLMLFIRCFIANDDDEDDLKSLSITLSSSPSSFTLNEGTVSLSVGSNCKLWTDSKKVKGPNQLSWDLSDSDDVAEFNWIKSHGLYVEGVKTGVGQISLSYSGFGLSCEDLITVTVVQANLTVTDLFETITEANELYPGAFIHFNLDNDDASNNATGAPGHPGGDYLENPSSGITGENDLVQLALSVSPTTLGSIELTASGNAKIWKSATKKGSNTLIASGSTKTWDLSDPTERTDFANTVGSLFVEGAGDSGSVTSKWKDPDGNTVYTDVVEYTFIAADCGDQPRTDGNYGGTGVSERDAFENQFASLVRCEWSVTDHDPDGLYPDRRYNCIAWSVDESNVWYNKVLFINGQYRDEYWNQGVHYVSIDKKYGDGNNVFDVNDMNAFYYKKKGWTPITSGTNRQKAEQAEAMYYHSYHGARRKNCSCGDGKWIMYESKCGPMERIEHVWDQVNAGYGAPGEYYK